MTENGDNRSIYRHVNSGGSFGANPLRQCIGTGKAKVINTMEVYWPTTDKVQRFHNIMAGTMIEVREGSDELRFIGIN